MAQNIYDTPDFFAGYSRLPRSVQGLDGAPEWPSLRALLPPLAGRRVVDLGCGFGWFARWAAEQGAAAVLGLDLSEQMLARARVETASPAVAYRRADLESLDLPGGGFDLAYSSLAFHYVEDFARLARTIHHALLPGAAFVFSIEHPIYMAPSRPGWMAAEDGRRVWPLDCYSLEGPRVTDWLAPGVRKYHRSLGMTLNTLIVAGFTLRHVEEWHPDQAQLAAHPEWAEEMDRPMFLLIAAGR
ncbi:methyltransferase domain-containing protein [Roseomonas sp. OT10]|uniref:class I SAM-dependent methyltransferase n=1 Tax=Roseomonas cutis TaxID=2897332 RepID=UPI001E5D6105|nr:class I SAM-dependent methyltransferase [Roseomonas sp. OT10]UFN47987.1 methyltransferase domain-containing protein [Roseomonas sp. OT10]